MRSTFVPVLGVVFGILFSGFAAGQEHSFYVPERTLTEAEMASSYFAMSRDNTSLSELPAVPGITPPTQVVRLPEIHTPPEFGGAPEASRISSTVEPVIPMRDVLRLASHKRQIENNNSTNVSFHPTIQSAPNLSMSTGEANDYFDSPVQIVTESYPATGSDCGAAEIRGYSEIPPVLGRFDSSNCCDEWADFSHCDPAPYEFPCLLRPFRYGKCAPQTNPRHCKIGNSKHRRCRKEGRCGKSRSACGKDNCCECVKG